MRYLIFLLLLSSCAYGRIGEEKAFFMGQGKFKAGDKEIESRILPGINVSAVGLPR